MAISRFVLISMACIACLLHAAIASDVTQHYLYDAAIDSRDNLLLLGGTNKSKGIIKLFSPDGKLESDWMDISVGAERSPVSFEVVDRNGIYAILAGYPYTLKKFLVQKSSLVAIWTKKFATNSYPVKVIPTGLETVMLIGREEFSRERPYYKLWLQHESIDNDAQVIWRKDFIQDGEIAGAWRDEQGDFLLAGNFDNEKGNSLASKPHTWLIKLSSAGVLIQTFQDPSMTNITQVIPDKKGNIYVGGNRSPHSYEKKPQSGWIKKISWEQDGLVSIGDLDTKSISDSNLLSHLALDFDGNLYVCGQMEGLGKPKIWLAKYRLKEGVETLWVRKRILQTYSGYTQLGIKFLEIDSNNNIYLGGDNTHLISGSSYWDTWIKKFTADGDEVVRGWDKLID